jgi:hypothetical protein
MRLSMRVLCVEGCDEEEGQCRKYNDNFQLYWEFINVHTQHHHHRHIRTLPNILSTIQHATITNDFFFFRRLWQFFFNFTHYCVLNEFINKGKKRHFSSSSYSSLFFILFRNTKHRFLNVRGGTIDIWLII